MSVQDWGDSSIALPLASQALTSTTECQRKHKRAPHAILCNGFRLMCRHVRWLCRFWESLYREMDALHRPPSDTIIIVTHGLSMRMLIAR